MSEWLNWYIYTMEFYSAVKGNELLMHITGEPQGNHAIAYTEPLHCMKKANLKRMDTAQSHLCNIPKITIIEMENRLVIARG